MTILCFRQRGLSMIELMLAMVLGIFLIGGISTVYISSKKTYKATNQLSQQDENARIAIKALREHIEHAGYMTTGIRNFAHMVTSTPSSVNCSGGDSNIVNASSIRLSKNNLNSFGDSVAVAFRADSRLLRDCSGGGLPAACLSSSAASMVYNSFFVAQPNASRPPALYCGGSRNYVIQPLAEGVENIQFLYGEDNDGADNGWVVSQYVTANAVTDWSNIIAIKAALLVRSVDTVFDYAESKNYNLFGESITTNDKYQRAVYTTTIYLRNIVR